MKGFRNIMTEAFHANFKDIIVGLILFIIRLGLTTLKQLKQIKV